MSDPVEIGQFEFVRLSALRVAQLIKGCVARVPVTGKVTTTARSEVAARKVIALPREPPIPPTTNWRR